jgi:hypothetical protein
VVNFTHTEPSALSSTVWVLCHWRSSAYIPMSRSKSSSTVWGVREDAHTPISLSKYFPGSKPSGMLKAFAVSAAFLIREKANSRGSPRSWQCPIKYQFPR